MHRASGAARPGALMACLPRGLAHAPQLQPRRSRRRAVGVVCRYEFLLEPAVDETIRRAIVTMGGSAPSTAAAAAAAAAASAPGSLLHGAHHAASSASGAQAGLFLSTFCALSVALGALLYHFGGVVSELMLLQKQKGAAATDPALLYGVDVSRSALLRDEAVAGAVRFAAAAHEGQFRKTGEPYVSHCVEAALIVERNLPRREAEADRHRAAVMAAVLHDVLDDTSVGYADLEEAFGPRVAGMVAQVSKLSSVNQMLRRDKRRGVISADPVYWQSTWRRLKRMMVEAVMAEPLVILIKLADRLHNMRTLHCLARDKQAAVAEETLHVWCSMAGYLGWHALKSEMEDLCFAVLEESTYCSLRRQLDELWSSPPAPARRRARDSGRRRQLERAAERHEQQREEAAVARAAAAAARGRGPFAGLWAWTGGVVGGIPGVGSGTVSATAAPRSSWGATIAADSTTITTTTTNSNGGSSGSGSSGSTSVMTSISSSTNAAMAAALAGPAGAAAPSAAPEAPADAAAPLVWLQEAAARAGASSGAGGGGWLSDSGPLLPAPLAWREAEGASGGLEGDEEETGQPDYVWRSVDSTTTPSNTATTTTTTSSSTTTTRAAAPSAPSSAAPPASPPAPRLTVQQQRLRDILRTVVPFDAVSFKSASDLSWSAQRGLSLLDEAAGQLYTELSFGSFGSGLDVVIQGRLKSLYSVHRKMMRKGCPLEEVYDARALRVIVDDCGGARLGDAIQCCYRLVASVHQLWRPIANEYDDYVSNPKASGYQALHTAVWGPGGAALEVQIKTRSMHEDAEYGGAAHWAYKEGGTQAAGGAVGAEAAAAVPSAAAGGAAATGSHPVGDGGGGSLVGSFAAATPSGWSSGAWGASDGVGGGTVSPELPEDSHAGGNSNSSSSSTGGFAPANNSPTHSSEQQHAAHSSACHHDQQQHQQQQDGHSPAAVPSATSPINTQPAPRPAAAPAAPAAALGALPAPPPSPQPPRPLQPLHQQPPPRAGGPYPGQPIVRISHCLRYGVVLSCKTARTPGGGRAQASGGGAGSGGGGGGGAVSVIAVIQNGGTSPEHPLRVPDYSFYAHLAAYARGHGWGRPGQGDLRARVEEFVLCRDGRWHRRDHLGYTHPNTTLTLLEGYGADAEAAAEEEEAAAAAAAGEGRRAAGAAAAAPRAGAQRELQPAKAGVAAAAAAVPGAGVARVPVTVPMSDAQGGAMAAAAAAALAAEEQERWQQQWRATATKAAQLRSVIEWGQDLAVGFEAPTQGEEVSVLIWPGGTIEDLPRGTTAGQLFRRKGVLTIEETMGGAGGRGSSGSVSVAGVEKRFNVNNRLVGADTPLEDGDLVILANHVLKI